MGRWHDPPPDSRRNPRDDGGFNDPPDDPPPDNRGTRRDDGGFNDPPDDRYFGLPARQFNLAFLAVIGVIALGAFLYFGGACTSEKPEQSVYRFVASINDSDFNDAYRELDPGCQERYSLRKFEEAYGSFFSDFVVESSLKVEDIVVTRVSDREATIAVDWILDLSVDNPLPLLGNLAEESVPLESILDVAGTGGRPLHLLDMSGSGDWRLEDCDPLGLYDYNPIGLYDYY